MTLFASENNESAAAWLADTIPLVMRTLRAEMRRHRASDLSVPQFRALAFLRRHPGASLSSVAEHVGLTLPSTSKMIDRLVTRRLVARADCPDDRRRVTLTLTPAGASVVEQAAQATQARLAEMLAALSSEERATLVEAMRILQRVFGLEAVHQ